MTVIDDAQASATTNATADAKDDNNTGGNFASPGKHVAVQGSDSSKVAAPASVSFTSGTAKQVNTTQDTMLYIDITTSAALAIALGSTSSVTTALSASKSDALGLITIRVPKGWYVKLTGTMADVACTQIPC